MTSKMLLFLAEIIIGIGAIGTTAAFVSQKVNHHGVITGILYVFENSSAVIDGQIVCNGDTIYGAKVIRIEKSTVEFEKNGIQWKQGLRETPNPAWKTPNQ